MSGNWARNPEFLGKVWWHKVEPVLTTLRNASATYLWPSSSISIDKLMIRCFGRSFHTYKMPNKPISQGYKIFALADHGYMWTFTPSSRTVGLVEFVKHKDLTMTGSMVLYLVNRLPKTSAKWTVYLDNYFTSISLFDTLRSVEIGACGTTRPKAAGPDFPLLFKSLKDYIAYIPFHTLYAMEVRQVLCLAWQDNNIVLGLSTVHTVDQSSDLIEQERRRPSKTSTNAAIVRHLEINTRRRWRYRAL